LVEKAAQTGQRLKARLEELYKYDIVRDILVYAPALIMSEAEIDQMLELTGKAIQAAMENYEF
jgi:adenosylmethionine-8-amino-7-oxononanoate aminotransferase